MCYKTGAIPVRLPPPVPSLNSQATNNASSEVEKALNRLNLNNTGATNASQAILRNQKQPVSYTLKAIVVFVKLNFKFIFYYHSYRHYPNLRIMIMKKFILLMLTRHKDQRLDHQLIALETLATLTV